MLSKIKKNKTEFRANLELFKSLDSIMVIKMNSLEELIPCHKWNFQRNSWEVVNQRAGSVTKRMEVTKIIS